MPRKILWLILSWMALLSIVLASCAPAAPPPTAPLTTTAPTTVTPTVAPTTATATTAEQEKPRYGGTLTYPVLNDTLGFDQVYLTTGWDRNAGQQLVYDRLLVGDWTMGAAGSNKVDFSIAGWMPEGIFAYIGRIAESWEVPDDQTIIYHIRKGVHFQDKSPVNGRELDANDVAFSIGYVYLNPKMPNAYNVVQIAGGIRLLSATATDKWTVVVKTQGIAWTFFEWLGVMGVHIIPHEVIDKYGDLKDWHNEVGSGPFLLTDYVPGSSFSFARNPNYWMKNPLGPGQGDQLPYVDGVKILIIKDRSTAQAAFRTGKFDLLGPFSLTQTYDDYQLTMKTNPQTKAKMVIGTMEGVGIRLTSTDPLAKPLMNQRVRQALAMSIDRQEIIKSLYSGQATLYAHFFPASSPYYTAPADMPKTLEGTPFNMKPDDAAMVKKMFEYHPDEAKKILAAEGYPNGFKTVVITTPDKVDFLSILKDYWAKNLNVDVAIDVKESTVYQNTIDNHQTQAMFYYALGGPMGTNPARFVFYGPGNPNLPFTVSNRWELSDPILDDYIQQVTAGYGKDLVKQNTLLKEIEPYIAWKAPWIAAPGPNTYNLWQPWLKNFYGFESVGFRDHHGFARMAWIDQDLKKEMGR